MRKLTTFIVVVVVLTMIYVPSNVEAQIEDWLIKYNFVENMNKEKDNCETR